MVWPAVLNCYLLHVVKGLRFEHRALPKVAGSNQTRDIECLSLVGVACCQVEVCASG